MNDLFEAVKTGKAKPTAIDLFAGAGGFSLGVEMAGFDVRAAVEFEHDAAETYRRNRKHARVLEEDIRFTTGERLMRIAGVKKGELDFLFGGPPCQGYTTVNVNRSVDDPRSKLMFEFVRMIREIKPKVFVIENVPGLVGFKDFFIMLLDVLEKCEYKVRFILMDACSYGVPQHRRRVLIQGVRNDLGYLPTFEPPMYFDDPKDYEGMFPPSMVAVKCFAKNGFSKEEVRDVYWNHKLWILMNKKTAADVVEKAINELIGETMFNHIKTKGGKRE